MPNLIQFLKTGRTRAALAVVLAAAAGCRDTTYVAGPAGPDDPAAPPSCETADCVAFRKLDIAALRVPLASAAQLARTSLQDPAFGARLAQRVEGLLADLEAARREAARVAVVGLLTDIDAAMGAQTFREDLPDLSAIRLNLEPVVIQLGLR